MITLEQVVKLPVKKKLAILLALVLIVAVAFWFIYYNPINEELDRLKDQHGVLQREKDDVSRRMATYEKDRQRRDDLKKSFGQQLRALPEETEMSSFLNNLNSHAELVGLEIKSVKPKNEEPAQYYARIPVQLTLSGTYFQLAKFFFLVGSLDRIINIENIKLKAGKFEDSVALLNAEVLATTFRSVQRGETPRKGKKG